MKAFTNILIFFGGLFVFTMVTYPVFGPLTNVMVSTALGPTALCPDFSRYVHHFSNFNIKYPHYSGVLRKSGLLTFLDDYNISFNFGVSSYILKSTYVNTSQNEDWSLRFKVYFGSKLSINYFKLQKSFLKFFVVGKKFLI